MRLAIVSLCLLACFLAGGCTKRDDEKKVTPESLLRQGFVQSSSDPTIYDLTNVTVAEAARRLGFSITASVQGTNNPWYQDIRGVRVRDYHFALLSEEHPDRFMAGVLTNPATVCTVRAQLIPQLREKGSGK